MSLRIVADVMQRDVLSVEAGARLDVVDALMDRRRIRHMVVVEDKRVVGVLSSRDLVAASLSDALDFEDEQRRVFLRSVDVAEVMVGEVVTVRPETTLRQAAGLLTRNHIGCLPVVESGDELVGLVTETDLLRAAFLDRDAAIEVEATVVEPVAEGQAESRLHDDIEELKRWRDEIRLQLNLGGTELRDRWDRVERRFHEAEREAKRIAGQKAEEAERAVRATLEEVREAYEKFWEQR